MTRKTKGTPDEIDIYVGERIREAYLEAGLSMEKLADKCDITYQQVQKYCSGKNRVAPGRLWKIAIATGKEISFFFPAMYGVNYHSLPVRLKTDGDIEGQYPSINAKIVPPLRSKESIDIGPHLEEGENDS